VNSAPGAQFISVRGRATALLWLLGVAVALAVVAVWSDLMEADLLRRIAGAGGWSDADATANDVRQGVIAGAELLLFIATAIVWLAWFSTAYKNLPALGARNLRFKPGWAIGAWFVPFLNLVRPKAMTDDTWRASDPQAPPVQEQPLKGQPVTVVLHLWWALFLISGVLGQFVGRWALVEDQTIEQLRSLNIMITFSDLLDIPLAILAMVVVRQITTRQEERARLLAAAPASPSPTG
jgi:hypothetical protein